MGKEDGAIWKTNFVMVIVPVLGICTQAHAHKNAFARSPKILQRLNAAFRDILLKTLSDREGGNEWFGERINSKITHEEILASY